MRKRLWDLAKSRIEIGTILPGHRHKVHSLRKRTKIAPPEPRRIAAGGRVSRHRRPHVEPPAPRRCSTAPAIQRAPPKLLVPS